jgi:hypothetical protein
MVTTLAQVPFAKKEVRGSDYHRQAVQFNFTQLNVAAKFCTRMAKYRLRVASSQQHRHSILASKIFFVVLRMFAGLPIS